MSKRKYSFLKLAMFLLALAPLAIENSRSFAFWIGEPEVPIKYKK